MSTSNLFYQLDQQILQITENLNAAALFSLLENRYKFIKADNLLVNDTFWIQYKQIKQSLFIGEDAIRSALKLLVVKGLIATETKQTAKGSFVIITLKHRNIDKARTISVKDAKEEREAQKIKDNHNLTEDTASIKKTLLQTNINQSTMQNKKAVNQTQFILAVKKQLLPNKEYSNTEIKAVLNAIGKEQGIKGSIPATAIETIATVQKLDTRRDGKKFKGYKIISYNADVKELTL